MGPPRQLQETSFTDATRQICRAAFDMSTVASALPDHKNAAVTPEIKAALVAALLGTQRELLAAHVEVRRVAYRVAAAAGLVFQLDRGWAISLYDGQDYDMHHNRHPHPPGTYPNSIFGHNYGLAPPPLGPPFLTLPPQTGRNWPYPKLPGEP